MKMSELLRAAREKKQVERGSDPLMPNTDGNQAERQRPPVAASRKRPATNSLNPLQTKYAPTPGLDKPKSLEDWAARRFGKTT